MSRYDSATWGVADFTFVERTFLRGSMKHNDRLVTILLIACGIAVAATLLWAGVAKSRRVWRDGGYAVLTISGIGGHSQVTPWKEQHDKNCHMG